MDVRYRKIRKAYVLDSLSKVPQARTKANRLLHKLDTVAGA